LSESVQMPSTAVGREGLLERRPRPAVARFGDIYRRNGEHGRRTISFELYPPRTAEDERTLYDKTVPQLLELRPAFFTVTYGAGGSTRERTLDIATRVKRETGIEVAAHLACVGSTVEYIESFLSEARDAGIENIVAIRGDLPKDQPNLQPAPGAPRYGRDLVRLIKRHGSFGVAVGGYPEGHTECVEGREVDWLRTKEKIEAGADIVVTQLFYDNRDYYHFEQALRTHGIEVPIVPGVLPILSTAQIKRFVGVCGATLPGPLLAKLEAVADDPAAAAQLGIDHAVAQCRDLLRQGACGFHFYTLNRATAVRAILEQLEDLALPAAE
jgi:methylenetetrahydrofolate reductase (NADPH)